MFALGGAVLLGLYLSPRGASPASPNVPWRAPPRTLRFVSLDCGGAGFDQLKGSIEAVRQSGCDFVLLQQVPAGEVLLFVEGLGLQQSYYTNLFQRIGPGGRDEIGCLILSKHLLYDARPLAPEGRRGPHIGTWAVAAVDGSRFAVISAAPGAGGTNPAASEWRAGGSPPVVTAVASAQDRLAHPAPSQWQRVSADGSILADGHWFVVERNGERNGAVAGLTAVTLTGAPPSVVIGVPNRTLRFVAYNIYHDYRGLAGTTAEVRKLDPPADFVLLAEVEAQNVRPWAEALKTTATYYPPVGRQPDGSVLWPDTVILARHPLSEGRPLRTKDGHAFGLWSMAVVDGKKFAVAVVHLWPTFGIDPRHVAFTAQMRNEQLKILIDVWQRAGSPPLVIGGDFNQPAVGENYALMTRHFSDAMKAAGRDSGTFPLGMAELRIDYFLTSPEWAPKAGGVEKSDASDHRPIWINLGAGPGASSKRGLGG
jgi:endonuclease/exonuclease/phosphatase family metal-dependent hydrolase